jgi:hypothetical protein
MTRWTGLIAAVLASTALAASVGAPTAVTATAATNGSVMVSWAAVSGAAGYNIYAATSAAGLPTATSATPTVNGGTLNSGSMTSYTFPAGSCGSTCYYEVTAWNCTGSCTVSAFSAAVSATVPASPPPVASPTGFTVQSSLTGCSQTPASPTASQPVTYTCTGITQTVTPVVP